MPLQMSVDHFRHRNGPHGPHRVSLVVPHNQPASNSLGRNGPHGPHFCARHTRCTIPVNLGHECRTEGVKFILACQNSLSPIESGPCGPCGPERQLDDSPTLHLPPAKEPSAGLSRAVGQDSSATLAATWDAHRGEGNAPSRLSVAEGLGRLHLPARQD